MLRNIYGDNDLESITKTVYYGKEYAA